MALDLEKLNAEQKAGVLYAGGPLLVLAGAGTGKTRVITFRIAQLIQSGVPAERILAVTFTNKAAGEMRRRIEELAPGKGALVWAHTFHAFACRLLRQHHELLGLTRHFTIYDQSDQKKLVVEAMRELGLEEQTNKAGMYVSIISRAKDDLLDAQSYAIYAATSIDASRQTAARIYVGYQRRLDQAGALDFGDLLMKTCLLLKEHQSVREYYQEYFLHLLVDEYQDTNHAQYILTKTLAAKHRNICVVGDDDQCLPPGTRVMTPAGPKKIEDIKEGEKVFAGSGWGKAHAAAVEKVMSRPYRGPLLRISFRSGRVLRATPNHICFARLDHRASAVIRGQSHRRYVWFTVFGDRRPKTKDRWHEHRIQLVTSDKALREKAEGLFPVRGGKRETWRIETSRKDYDQGLELARAICSLDGLDVVSRARLVPGKPFFFMPAAHLQPGMAVPCLENGRVVEDVVDSVESAPYEGKVYDLSVPHLRNFVAESVLVHNSVYSWRGANIRNILEFERDFKDAKVVTLEQNYRSTSTILNTAGKVIRNNKSRKIKNLWTEKEAGESIRVQELPNEMEEAGWVTRRIEDLISRGRSLKDIAIFYRTNAQSRSFEEALRRAGYPYRIVGAMRFYERKEIKDALCYARAILNPADSTSLSRILNVPPRGIGKTSLERLEAFALASGLTLWQAFKEHEKIPNLTAACRKAVADLVAILDKLRAAVPGLSAAGAIARILEESGYWQWLESETETDPEAAGRLNNLQELLNAVKEYEEKAKASGVMIDLGQYLEEVSLQSDIDSYDPDQPALTLMTVHLAKGLEYPAVFLTGLEEGLFPIGAGNSSPEDLEEERRLCYVGITRARELLFLTHAATRRIFGQVYANLPSRFILEAQLLGTPESAAVGSQSPAPSGRPSRAPSQTPARLAGFRVGMRVKHPSFGTGQVLEKSGSGEAVKVTVRFDDGRTTKLLVRYAPLEPA